MAPPTVLTGAGGWFGRAYLTARRDEPVRALAGSPAEVPDILEAHPGARVHVGDVADRDLLARLFDGADGASVVHAAGVIHPHRHADFDRVNHHGTRAVLDAAVRAGVRRLVHVSSNSPFGTNADPDDVFGADEPYRPYGGYGASKMRAEQAVLAADLETVVVRPPWFYGPHQPPRQTRFLTMARTGRFPVPGDGSQRRSMTYVDNLVQGVVLAEQVPQAAGRAFWIADERPYRLAEVLEAARTALAEAGLPVSRRQLRVPAVVSRTAGRVDLALQRRGVYHQELHVVGELDKTIACDVSAARDVLGYRPEVALAEGMRRTVAWCLARGIEI